jgi:hypothetical protein
MGFQESIAETTDYRLILVQPDSRKVLTIKTMDGHCLPSVGIPPWTRPAKELQRAIQARWKLHVIILDLLASPDGGPFCAVAEVLPSEKSAELGAVAFEQLEIPELSEQQRTQLGTLPDGGSLNNSPFSQIGWIDQAITWVESETGRKLSSKSQIEQYNASGAFSLVRFPMEDDSSYWLKATGTPNAHEPSITRLLSELGGDYLPEFIASKPEWNAWLMSGEVTHAEELPTEPYKLFCFLNGAVKAMGELQMKTQRRRNDLLEAGAFDQSIEVFREHSEALFDYLEEAMSFQSSTKVPRLERSRLQNIRMIFETVCRYMEDLDLPETIVHGDLNCGNILIGCGHCRFIDWCEAHVGSPLVSLQHLLLLNKSEHPETRRQINLLLKERYLKIWAASCHPDVLNEGFICMPLLSIVSTLYGRGDWLNAPKRNDPRRMCYARTLARHMDRATREREFLEALCH